MNPKNLTRILPVLLAAAFVMPYYVYATSIENLQRECVKKRMRSCKELGDVERKNGNFDAAMGLFKMACEGKVVQACYDLAVIENARANTPEAKSHFKQACKGGVKAACTQLKEIETENTEDESETQQEITNDSDKDQCGTDDRSDKNTGTPEDRAVRKWERECASGGPICCQRAAGMANGYGFKFEAKKLFKIACGGGLMASCRLYGVMQYEDGNLQEALVYVKKACKNGLGEACTNVEMIDFEVERQKTETKKLYGP